MIWPPLIAVAEGFEVGKARAGNEPRFTGCARQQHAAFLVRFADRGDLDRARGGIGGCAVAEIRQRRIFVLRIDLAAGEHQRAGRKIDLVVPDHHEHFERRVIAAQQQNRGRRNGPRAARCSSPRDFADEPIERCDLLRQWVPA